MDETDQPLTNDEIWTKLAGADVGERVELMLELAERAAEAAEPERTIALAAGAAEAAESVGRVEAQARAAFLMAEAHAAVERTEEALECYRRAAEHYRSLVDEEAVGGCHFRAGWALRAAGRLEEAFVEWRTAEQLWAQLPDGDDDVGRAVLARADGLATLGRHDEALDALGEARASFQRHGDATHTAWVDDRAAGVLRSLGRTEEAVTWLERCLVVAEAAGDAPGLARAHGRLAEALRADGRFSAALVHAKRARKGFRQVGDHRSIAGCDLEAAICYAELGEPEKAETRFTRARALYDATGADALVRTVDMHWSVFLWANGRDEESAAVATRVLESALEDGDAARATRVAARLARTLLRLGRAERAAEVLGSVHEPPGGSSMAEHGFWLATKARVAACTGDHTAAERLATEGIELVADLSYAAVETQLYEARSQARQVSDPVASDADRARAVALALAAGDVVEATRLAQPLLPAT